jgi:peptidoglycan hydrolase-like protein with peptidoglycan-binding domain
MHLREFYESGLEYSLAQVAGDRELTIDIQTTLIWVGLIESANQKPDGQFGPITTGAFEEFQQLTKCPKIGIFDKATAKALIETSPEKIRQLVGSTIRPGDDLAGRVIKYMIAKGYSVSQQIDTYNIVYIEGIDPDGTLNADEMNYFNDLRMVIKINAMGEPEIVGKWFATTEPGSQYTNNPISDYAKEKGAARIKFGQYKAWRVGRHNPDTINQLALLQKAELPVYRDKNKDGFRNNDIIDTGDWFGINQHHANDSPRKDIGPWGAGCLVGQTSDGHQEFMDIIRKDKRYKQNNSYLFETTIIAGDDLNKMFPI